jgi:hypothetical protein
LARTPPPLVLTAPERWDDEHDLQIACTEMLERILLEEVEWSAVDHGHSLDMRKGRHGVPIGVLEAKKRKRRGIKTGLCDYYFWHQDCAFAIEMKMPDGVLRDDQRKHIKGLIRNGVLVKVCYSTNLVFNTVVEWHLTRPMQVTA